MGDLSLHFSRHEFALPADKAAKKGLTGAEYPAEWVETRLRPLCMALEVIRAEFRGKPIRIISAYRPLPYNRSIGSEDDSQHVQGRAADFQIDGVDPGVIWDRMLALRHVGRLDIGGAGVYDTFCHVDVRGGSLHTWDKRGK